MPQTVEPPAPLRVAYLGNFVPPFSTENDIARALRAHPNVSLETWQEGDTDLLERLIAGLGNYDLLMWTATPPTVERVGYPRYWELLSAARSAHVPVVGVHLDRWWDLERESQIDRSPFFAVDVLFTADGGHDHEWAGARVEHVWMPPAISESQARTGLPSNKYRADIVFVGAWQTGRYHPEWEHRYKMVEYLRRKFDRRVRFLPVKGNPRIVGHELADVYASAKVVIGDSCLVPHRDGRPMTRYCSDRIPETLGRAGLLLHPFVDGVTGPLFRHHWWKLGDFEEMRDMIETLCAQPEHERLAYAAASQAEVIEEHTYEVRVREILVNLAGRGLIPSERLAPTEEVSS